MFKNNNPISLSIPNPCSENWQQMTPLEKGRFCASCQKKVYDFTTASDREIAIEFRKNENLCGRFKATQLDRELIVPKEKSSVWMATTAAIISFLAVGTKEIYAQGSIKLEQTDKKIMGDTIQLANRERTIAGVVSTKSGLLPGANVIIKGTTKGVQTDLNGNYSIKVKEGDILVFTFLGFYEEEIYVTENTKPILDIQLIEYTKKKMEELICTVGVITIKKRSFFGNIFHSIRNWFR